ncbi:isopentenyl-diphosphate Delta-isomerase [Sanguibacter sp. HDW7]|uniref:isopentenyl-diphosphate Delta-isomerase n=1 Tax=Sanguibacter sp. HDW7 TaxID=2714931 RepID=UPI00140B9CA9|nr:isopentenyl-diphosphate Delta-isomerase [Sanguibacter sp. HDW7]QIK84237.1 isopentenyl-diphosphate Delta-isomerase [Sanguibacter sp. HDW7]
MTQLAPPPSTSTHDSTDDVVLLDDAGRPTGTAPRERVHGAQTPLHLAFSCHVVDDDGSVLLSRRALTKRSWPGVWTNAFCGHPRPGEDLLDAVLRHGRAELGLTTLTDLDVVLPDFRYRAVDAHGTVENELCPVVLARVPGRRPPVTPDPREAVEVTWVDAADLGRTSVCAPWSLSPWAVAQLRELAALEDLR